jgi:microtubule-associated protein-like 6
MQVFVEGLLQGPPKMAMQAQGVQRGPYQAGQPASHTGQILYRPCRRGVLPPSDWEPALAKRSAQLPEPELQLDFVHGYDGFQSTSPNLFYDEAGGRASGGQQCMHAARVGGTSQLVNHGTAWRPA